MREKENVSLDRIKRKVKKNDKMFIFRAKSATDG